MSSPKSATAEEIPLSEHTKYVTLFDGVYMDEQTYRDYVIKTVMYDRLEKRHNELVVDFESYKELSKKGCGEIMSVGGWFIVGLLLTGFAAGYVSGR